MDFLTISELFQDTEIDDVLDNLYAEFIIDANILIKRRNVNKKNVFGEVLTLMSRDQWNVLLNFLAMRYSQAFDKLMNTFHDALIKGDVPRTVQPYVQRKVLLKRLRTLLVDLQANSRIVIHGMPGSGKSNLAAEAIKDCILITKCFSNKVFWINLREINTVKQLIGSMQLLLQRLNYMFEEFKLPVWPILLADSAMQVEAFRDALKNIFRKDGFRNALIVLDNVSYPYALHAFDVGCKVLITTYNKKIVEGTSVHFMEVNEGFTKEETISLFASCLEVSVEQLPRQSTMIHKLCSGFPPLIYSFGCLLKNHTEYFMNHSERWDYYIDKFKRKDFVVLDGFSPEEKLISTVRLCIMRLKNELRELYMTFAVFTEQVNITPKVLQVFWDLQNTVTVEEKMTHFHNVSLVSSFYNKDMKTYIYQIHDFLLFYLRQQYSEDERVHLHKRLIVSYERNCNGKFAHLPDDNYIFYYIGYHLLEAKMYNYFKKIYFDLHFLEAKIKIVGSEHLLEDFRQYGNNIACNEDDAKKLNDYYNFVKSRGDDLYKYKYTNVVQTLLEEPKESSIYETALKVAQNDNQHLYFQVTRKSVCDFTNILNREFNVTAVCFTLDANRILVGTYNGDISLWKLTEKNNNYQLCSFKGHSTRIVHMQLRQDGKEFLSLSEDGCVKLWELCKDFYNISEIQDNYLVRCTFELPSNILHADRIISATYSCHCEEYIITGSLNGSVMIWGLKNKGFLTVSKQNQPVSCVLCSEDNLLVFTCDSNIFLYDFARRRFILCFYNDVPVKMLLIVPRQGILKNLIVIGENSVVLWKWDEEIRPYNDEVVEWHQQDINVTKVELYSCNKTKFVCGEIIDEYLITSSDDFCLRLWNTTTKTLIWELNKGPVLCFDIFRKGTSDINYVFVFGIKNTIQQWQIKKKEIQSFKIPVYHVFWNERNAVTAIVTAENKVQILHNQNLIAETEVYDSLIKNIHFSLCGNKIVIGLENGSIVEFDYTTRKSRLLFSVNGSVSYLQYFEKSFKSQRCMELRAGVLVAATKSGCITIFKNGKVIDFKLVHESPMVSCFYLKSVGKFLSIFENHMMMLWNLSSSVVLVNDKQLSRVITVCISTDQLHLAVLMDNKMLEMYTVKVEKDFVDLLFVQKMQPFDSRLTCCSFSYDSSLLAVGEENGTITIWNTAANMTLLHKLELHKTKVNHLMFCHSEMFILVSAAEQIVWWDLSKLLSGMHKRIHSLSKHNGPKSILWEDKKGHHLMPYCLSSIKVRGLCAQQIWANQNFSTFLTVDSSGCLYIMEIITK